MKNTTDIQEWLIARMAEQLHTTADKISIREPFSGFGLSSLDIVTLSGDLEEFLGRRLSPTLAYDYPDILSLSLHLSGEADKNTAMQNTTAGEANEPIAVIGMACRFPGATDPEAFWKLLCDGTDMIREVPADRWDWKDVYDADPAAPGKSVSRWGGFLDNIDQFDASFFGIAPVEAKHMDPQQRMLLELSSEALDDAGQVPEELDGSSAGVFVGISVNEYSLLQLSDPSRIAGHTGTGSALSIAANRISYYFNFRGPSMALDTACSSSLAAIHLACQSLRNGECGIALAGGVNLILSPAHSIAFTKAGVLAPDGRCKTFDAEANGYVRGEGGGVVVLKRLSAALADGDPVQAVIMGSAMRQDGRTNGLIAPSQEGQEALLREAFRSAGVSPGQVQYVEAHGTGTLLGDSMEACALGAIIGINRTEGPCGIGSVKTNFGHLEAAAGIAGLIKVILSLQHRKIPPSLHYHTPNPHIPFKELNLEVNDRLREWLPTEGAALAGVSSFGFGGTNVHLVIKEYNPVVYSKNKKDAGHIPELSSAHLLTLSAPSLASLPALAGDILRIMEQETTVSVYDICYAAAARRSRFDYRMAITVTSGEELHAGLQSYLNDELFPGLVPPGKVPSRRPKLVFLFSGQGGQWYGMGRSLLKEEPVFYETIQRVDRLVRDQFGWSVMEELQAEEAENRLTEIDVVQPAIFAIQVALAALWRSWGVEPDAVLGHSMGEVAAAHVAGILTLEDAVSVVCGRSKRMKKLEGRGAMLATELSPGRAMEMIKTYGDEVSLAVINSPVSTVLSGNPAILEKVMEALQRENLFCKLVNVGVASHSPQIEPLRTELFQIMEGLRPRQPIIPFYSSVTGHRGDELDFTAGYWVDNIRQPVLFSNAVTQAYNDGLRVFIELGPHPVLLGPVQQTLAAFQQEIRLLPSMRRGEAERGTLLSSLGVLYTQGFSIDRKQLYPVRGKNVHFPLIPWQHQRFWVDKPAATKLHPWQSGSRDHALLGRRTELAPSSSGSLWQQALDVNTLPFLGDHRIDQEIIFPAAGFMEMALQAAVETGMASSHVLVDFQLHEVLRIKPEDPAALQSQLLPQEEGRFLFTVYSRRRPEDHWTMHASASMIEKNDTAIPDMNSENPETSYEQSKASFNTGEFYQLLEKRGLNYGPSFRAVQQVWGNKEEARGLVQLPGSLINQADRFRIHPVLLDASLQVLAATQTASSDNTFFVPTGCERIEVFDKPGTQVLSRVRVRPAGDHGNDRLIADIKIYKDSGEPVARITGLQLQRTSRRLRHQPLPHDTWLYYPRWKAKEDSNSVQPSLQEGLHWLIFTDEEGVGEAMAAELQAKKQSCRCIPFPAHIAASGMKKVGELEIFIRKTLEETPSPLFGIIYLWSPVVSSITDEDELLNTGCISLLYLIQSLAKRTGSMPRLWLVTRGAQAVIPGDRTDPDKSPLWGLGKTMSFEFPEPGCICIDLDPKQRPEESASQLARQLAIHDREDQLAFRAGKRYVSRLAPYAFTDSTNTNFLSFRPDASYLLTGGMGGLGLKTAAWMIRKGARHLVLMGRNKPSPEVMHEVEKMRHGGTTVVIAQADVSDLKKLRQIMDEIKTGMPPLRGVIHAAGILDDGALLNLDAERLKRVMAPKVQGTRNLHIVTAESRLDFFICYSSAVSVLGSPGQGNYAAASAYQDSMAYYRHQQQLPAISINWGPWAEVGLAAEATDKLKEQNASTQHLVKVIAIDRGLEILEQLMTSPAPQVMVLPFDLRNLIELYPTAAGMPFLEDVGGRETHVARLYARPNLRQEYVAPRNELEQRLATLWKQTLHIDRVGIHDSFFELGGDSVLAAQLLSSAQQVFGIRINPQDAFKAFTIERLADLLEAALRSKIEAMSESEVMEQLSKEK